MVSERGGGKAGESTAIPDEPGFFSASDVQREAQGLADCFQLFMGQGGDKRAYLLLGHGLDVVAYKGF